MICHHCNVVVRLVVQHRVSVIHLDMHLELLHVVVEVVLEGLNLMVKFCSDVIVSASKDLVGMIARDSLQ